MDKQIIEELEKDIAVRMAMAKGVAGSMNNGVEGWLGEYLIEKGWTQIPENAVVLTREEYEEFQIGNDFNYGYYSGESNMTSYYENIRLPEVRKETAEKFAEKTNQAINAHRKMVGEDEYIVDARRLIFEVNEICKELGGKV